MGKPIKKPVVFGPFPCASTNVNATPVKFKAPFAIRLEQATYHNTTGLATDDTNYFDVEVYNETQALSMAKFTTKTTGGDGAIAVDADVTLNLNATARNLQAAAGDVLSVRLTKHGTQTLPAGEITIVAAAL